MLRHMDDDGALHAAWAQVRHDCGCADVYLCHGAIECPRHGGFDVCCDRPDLHVPARAVD